MKTSHKNLGAVVAAHILWGVLPLYWKTLAHIPAGELVAHRAVWSALFLALVMASHGHVRESWSRFCQAGGAGKALPSALLIATNWLLYIWAIEQHRLVEASLGYFICPLLTVALGAAFLGERLSWRHGVALTLISLGVGLKIILAGTVPWLGLGCALTFAVYALVRKQTKMPPVEGVFWEMLLLAPFGLLGLLVLAGTGAPVALPLTLGQLLHLASIGLVTVAPMMLFTKGVAGLSLRLAGVAQYVSPSIKLLVATYFLGEPFEHDALVSYLFIWSGIAFYFSADIIAQRLARLRIVGTTPALGIK
ncbi:MAG: EamA family transporter RarD [Deltaproteobacteria bacterium]|nr:EamA family transporter RarD [Deltaproteobacteria bacterium]